MADGFLLSHHNLLNLHVLAVPGLYLIRLINGENVKVQKVVVR